MSLTSHKSFMSSVLYQCSLKSQRRKVGLVLLDMTVKKVRAARLLQSARPSLKMRGGMTFNAKKCTEKGGGGSSALSLRKFIECWLVFVYHSHFYRTSCLHKVQGQVFQGDAVGSCRSQWGGSEVKGDSWNTLGGPLDKLEKIFRHPLVKRGDLFCAEAKFAFFLLLFYQTKTFAPFAEHVGFFWNAYFNKGILFDPVRHVCVYVREQIPVAL